VNTVKAIGFQKILQKILANPAKITLTERTLIHGISLQTLAVCNNFLWMSVLLYPCHVNAVKGFWALWNNTVGPPIKLNATVTSWLKDGTAWLTAKRYEVFSIHESSIASIKTIKSTYITTIPAGSSEVTVAFNCVSERNVFMITCDYYFTFYRHSWLSIY
jgi:hypothetical protein